MRMPDNENSPEIISKILRPYGGEQPQTANEEEKRIARQVHKSGCIFSATLLGVIVIDMYVFRRMETWTAPLIIGGLEIIALMILADALKLDVKPIANNIRIIRKALYPIVKERKK